MQTLLYLSFFPCIKLHIERTYHWRRHSLLSLEKDRKYLIIEECGWYSYDGNIRNTKMQNYLSDPHACTDNAGSYLHISDIKEIPEILQKPQSCSSVVSCVLIWNVSPGLARKQMCQPEIFSFPGLAELSWAPPHKETSIRTQISVRQSTSVSGGRRSSALQRCHCHHLEFEWQVECELHSIIKNAF